MKPKPMKNRPTGFAARQLSALRKIFKAEYRAGDSIRVIAKRHGCSSAKVYYNLRRTGTVMRMAWLPAKERSALRKSFKAEYRRGDRIQDIAERHGCSTTRVYNHLRSAGIVLRSPRLTPKELAAFRKAIKKEYMAGRTGPEIAKRHGCPVDKVYHNLWRAGTVMRRARLNAKQQAAFRKAITAEYRAGDRLRVIAERHGCSMAKVHKYLRRAGTVMRRPRRSKS